MTIEETAIWISPLNGCDICGWTFGNGADETKIMYDAKVHGAWGNVCHHCFESDDAAKLGTGYGQQYFLTTRHGKTAWYKIAG